MEEAFTDETRQLSRQCVQHRRTIHHKLSCFPSSLSCPPHSSHCGRLVGRPSPKHELSLRSRHKDGTAHNWTTWAFMRIHHVADVAPILGGGMWIQSLTPSVKRRETLSMRRMSWSNICPYLVVHCSNVPILSKSVSKVPGVLCTPKGFGLISSTRIISNCVGATRHQYA